MKVLQTIAGMSASSGGPSTCTLDLMNALHSINAPVDLLTLDVKNPADELMGKSKDWIKVLPNDTITPYAYSGNMKRWLNESIYDIYHTNGLWMYCNHETCAVARRKGKPYIITPHGMLYPDALRRK